MPILYRSNSNNSSGDFGHTGFTPVGSLIFYDGLTPPDNYLVCDGTVYNIADYPELANHYETQYGSKNAFGGDGVTTFAVRDLQGEFLRAAGTNSHANQGNGANVGVHQNATIHTKICVGQNNMYTTNNLDLSGLQSNESDKIIVTTTGYAQHNPDIQQSSGGGTWAGGTYTSRPTNTSFLLCVAYKNIYIDAVIGGENTVITNPQEGQGLVYDATNGVWKNGAGGMHVYSTDERVVGKWIDGKPLYEKTFYTFIDVSSLSIDKCTHFKGCIQKSDGASDEIPSAWNIGVDVYVLRPYYDKSTNKIGVGTNRSALGSVPFILTIQYTKTTDTPTV